MSYDSLTQTRRWALLVGTLAWAALNFYVYKDWYGGFDFYVWHVSEVTQTCPMSH